jgi:DNA-binding NtrC family response regulator
MMIKGELIKILLVEDDAAHADIIRRALLDADSLIQVRIAGTLAAFRQAVAAELPDIALVDHNLPDGRAIEILVSPPEAAPFPIVVMTSYGNEQMAVEAMKAGALDYIVKSAEAFAGMPRSVERVRREWDLLMERKRAEEARKHLIAELENALAKVKTLSGLLPICVGCKKIRDDKGYWGQVEIYIQEHSEAQFTHSMCPECMKKYYPESKERGK